MNQFVESTVVGNLFGPFKAICSESGMYTYVVGYPLEGGFRTVYYSHNYGNTWTVVSTPVDNVMMWEETLMTSSSGQHVFGSIVRTTNSVAVVSHDYGVNWSVIFNGRILSASATGQYVYAINDTLSKFVVSSNYGATWSETSVYHLVKCKTNYSGQYAYAAYDGFIHISNDYGGSWNSFILAIANFAFNNYYVSGSGSTIVIDGFNRNNINLKKTLVSNDYGATWLTGSTIDGFYNIVNVAMSDDGQTIYVATYSISDNSSSIYLSTNGGVSFSTLNPQSGTKWAGVQTYGTGQTVYISGHDPNNPNSANICFVSYNYGSSWQQIQAPSGAQTQMITLASSGLYLYGYSDYYFYRTAVDAPISNVCFPAGTPVSTDQGVVPIEQLDKSVHTIRGKPIVALTKTIPRDSYLVCFEPDSFCPGLPEKRTIMSKEHAVMYKGAWTKARKLVQSGIGKKTRNHGHPLYNILLEEEGVCVVNGLLCETLHPQSGMARLYKDMETMTAEQRSVLIRDINHEMLRRYQARDEKRALLKRA
jgi:lipoprotein signal peptidase